MILYKTLYKLIGRKSPTDKGPFTLGIKARYLKLMSLSNYPPFRKFKAVELTSSPIKLHYS